MDQPSGGFLFIPIIPPVEVGSVCVMIVYCVCVFLFYLRCLLFKLHSINKSSSPAVCDKHRHCFHCTSEVGFSTRLETHLNLGISGLKFQQVQVSDPIWLLCISTLSKNNLCCLKFQRFAELRLPRFAETTWRCVVDTLTFVEAPADFSECSKAVKPEL